MLPARYRAAWHDGEWAGLGDPPTGFIVDFDEDSPTHKKLVAYWPHIEKAKEYFQLYMELAGDNSLLYRRLRESPIIFPGIEEWVDPRNVNRFKMAKYPGGGYYPKGKDTVVSMLTNPIYIGYRTVEGVIRRNSKGEKIIDHAPVIERDLFDFAYYRLAKVDLDGNPLEGKRPRRFFQQGSKGDYGLLKFRITSSQGEVRTHADGAILEKHRQEPGRTISKRWNGEAHCTMLLPMQPYRARNLIRLLSTGSWNMCMRSAEIMKT